MLHACASRHPGRLPNPPQCSAGSPVTCMIEIGRGREGPRDNCFQSAILPRGPLGPGPCPDTGQEARARAEEAPEPGGLGRGPWWQLQDVDAVPYLGLLALTPRPQPPLESGAPALPPKQTRYWVSVVWGRAEAVCLINHFRPPWETH